MYMEDMNEEDFICGPRVYNFEYHEALALNIVKDLELKI